MKKAQIKTERTQLRLMKRSDIETIHSFHSIPEVDQYNTLGIPKNIEETKKILSPLLEALEATTIEKYVFVIETIDTKTFMGMFGIHLASSKYNSAEIWYKLHPDYWNQGFATEIVKEVVSFGFNTLQLHRIEAGCAVANIGSIRVLEKTGFIKEGLGRQILPLATGWSDNYEYAILETDPR